MSTYDDLPLYCLFFDKRFDYLPKRTVRQKMVVDKLDNVQFVDSNCVTDLATGNRLTLIPNSLIIQDADCPPHAGFSPEWTYTRSDGTVSCQAIKVVMPPKMLK